MTKPNENNALQVEYWQLEKLIPYDKNVKIHNPKQVESLAKIIEKNGFRVPISVDEEGVIIAGHGRRLAMLHLNKKHKGKKFGKVPVIVQRGLTESQKDAARISDNKIGSNEYDVDLLNDEVLRLFNIGEVELDDLGMDDEEIYRIVEGLSLEGLTEIPDPDSGEKAEEEVASTKMPKEVAYKPSWQIVIPCSGEQEQAEIYEQISAMGIKCSVQTL